MNLLNNASSQLNELFRTMTVQARVTAGLLLIIVVVSLVYLFNAQGSSPDSELMHGMPIDPSQMPAMEAAFAKAGLSDYEVDGSRIRIPRGKHSAYMGALADADALPPNFGRYMEKALKEAGPFTNRKQQEELIKTAKQNELALIIRSMTGIEKAMVLYDIEKKSGLRSGNIITASVSVKPVGNMALDSEQVPGLRNLVAGAIAGLSPKNVSVTDLNSMQTYASREGGGGGVMDDEYASRKKWYERQWKEKFGDALALVPGAVLAVNVELNPRIKHHQTQVVHGPKQATTMRDEKTTTRTSEGSGPRGRPGAVANAAGGPRTGPAAVGATSAGSKTSEDTSESREIGVPAETTTTETVDAPLTPLKVKVAVGIPNLYIESVWKKRNPVAEGGEPTKLTRSDRNKLEKEIKDQLGEHLKALIPQSEDAKDTRFDINISVFEDVAVKIEIPEPDSTATALDWFGQNWSNVSLSLLALVSLIVLRGIVRSPSAPAPKADRSTVRPSSRVGPISCR